MEMPLVGRRDELASLLVLLEADGPAAAVVEGEPGVGKTRLLEALGDQAEAAGWIVRRIFGSRGIGQVPFGALGHELDDRMLSGDPTSLHVRLRRSLVGRTRGKHLLLVDDAHAVDDGTAAVIEQIAAHGEAWVVLALRRPPGPPASLVDIVGQAGTLRLRMSALDGAGTDELLTALVRGRPDEALRDAIWHRTLGLPLFVHVLVRAADELGILHRDGDRVRLSGTLPTEPIHELIRTRMRTLRDDARLATEVAAICRGVPVATIEAVAGPSALMIAEHAGFLHRAADGSTSVAHPLYAETISGTMSARRRREVIGDVVDALDEPDSPSQRVQRAVLALEAGRRLDADVATDAAGDAVSLLDPHLGERLARAAVEADSSSTRAHIALARTLSFQGRSDAANEVLAHARPSTPGEVAEVAVTRGHVLAFLLGHAEEAMDVLARAAAVLPSPHRAALDADRALYAAMRGTFGKAIEAAERVLSNPDATDLARIRAGANLILARSLLGQLHGLDEVREQTLELARRHRTQQPLAVLQCELTRVNTVQFAGRLADAEMFARARASPDDGDAFPAWLQWHGLTLDAVGRLDEAIEVQRRAIDGYRAADPFRLRSQAIGMLALHHGQTGRIPDDVPELLDEADAQAHGEVRLTVWLGRGRTWVDATTSPAAGAARALANGRTAIAHEHTVWGAMALHDAVRLGAPGAVRRELETAAADTTGAYLVEAMRDHAVALDESDTDALRDVAGRFTTFGALSLAVEAWSQLARIHADRGDRWAARRTAVAATLLHRRVPTLRTPAVGALPPGLTGRQLDVAQRAADGRASREIADELFLSVRTVDNHLRSIYRALDLSGREQLASVLLAHLPPEQGPSDASTLKP